MTAREDLATAAETVAGVTSCTAYGRQTLRPGDGYVRFARREPDPSGLGFTDVWQVWITLPQDLNAAEKWLEDHLDALGAALAQEMTVTAITPAELVMPSGPPTNGVVVEGARETS